MGADPDTYRETVTRRKVAGIEVVLPSGLWFFRPNSATSSRSRSAVLPFSLAATKAFIVGPK